MWLLDTRTLELHDFIGEKIPRYAILSYTWDDEEISFQDVRMKGPAAIPRFHKIRRCCELAHSQYYYHVWIDTCCINKESSAELSEAINSMYTWYAKSATCYVYLSDIKNKDWSGFAVNKNYSERLRHFRWSRWFRRGWTLQELLAPRHIHFYDAVWNLIGNKFELGPHLGIASGIPSQYIVQEISIHQASVAARMSWASNRQTTRLEDEAYCLMGIFDVNMPLLYGEGRKAFKRLQHEIARNLDDESLFAWHADTLQSGIFAPNPSAFAGCGAIQPIPDMDRGRSDETFTVTNRGLRIAACLAKIPYVSLHDLAAHRQEAQSDNYYFLMPLRCTRKGQTRPFTLIIQKISHGRYIRILAGEIMVHERYGPRADCVQWQRADRSNDQMIYIQEPDGLPQRTMSSAELPMDTVTPDEATCNCYKLMEGYASPPNCLVQPWNGSWSVDFIGWSGFAVLRFKGATGSALTIVLTHVRTGSVLKTVVLSHVTMDDVELNQTVEACYDQENLLQPEPEAYAEYSCTDKSGTKVTITRKEEVIRTNYDLGVRHVLSIEPTAMTSTKKPPKDVQETKTRRLSVPKPRELQQSSVLQKATNMILPLRQSNMHALCPKSLRRAWVATCKKIAGRKSDRKP